MIQVMKEEPKICHYLDLPIQHANDDILKRMGRKNIQTGIDRYRRETQKRDSGHLSENNADHGISGETQEQYEELYRFVSEMEFEPSWSLYIFTGRRYTGSSDDRIRSRNP